MVQPHTPGSQSAPVSASFLPPGNSVPHQYSHYAADPRILSSWRYTDLKIPPSYPLHTPSSEGAHGRSSVRQQAPDTAPALDNRSRSDHWHLGNRWYYYSPWFPAPEELHTLLSPERPPRTSPAHPQIPVFSGLLSPDPAPWISKAPYRMAP